MRQGSLFAGETLAARRRQPRVAQNLDGYLVAESFAFGEIDNAHAAFAQQARRYGNRRIPWTAGTGTVQRFLRELSHAMVEQRVAVGILLQHG